MKRALFTVCFLLFFGMVSLCRVTGKAEEERLIYPALIADLYQRNGGLLFWFTPGEEAFLLRKKLLVLLDSSFHFGLISKKYHYGLLVSNLVETGKDSASRIENDRYYTDAAIAVLKDIFQGYPMNPWMGFDPVSEKYAAADNEKILNGLLLVKSAAQLARLAILLEPADSAYLYLKQELIRQKSKNRSDSAAFVRLSMNLYRRIHHFRFDQLIVVNLAAARLYYYEKGRLVLNMKTIVGKRSTPSPRFAAWCDQAILYPYWYVPRSITFDEYLPIIKKNPSWLDAKNMQVIDGSGRVVNHHRLNWSSFHSGFFPYTIRQSTGCDNALGVIKFNINTPYGVYLHDTNNKGAFKSAHRYLSHGCIRLEDPFDLGYHLLEHTLDTAFLQSCFKQQKPVIEPLRDQVPVFSVYMPAWTGPGGKVIYYKDVYRLLK